MVLMIEDQDDDVGKEKYHNEEVVYDDFKSIIHE